MVVLRVQFVSYLKGKGFHDQTISADVVVGFFQETRRTNKWPADMGPGE